MPFRNIISRPLFIAATIAVIIIVAVVVTILALTGGSSTPSGTDTASANVVILLDRSTAMGEPLNGSTKLEGAIEVINEDILDQKVADLQNLAFRQYGGTCDGDNSELVVTFGQKNKDTIQDALGGIAIDGRPTLVSGILKGSKCSRRSVLFREDQG